jgi:hypothetical protein
MESSKSNNEEEDKTKQDKPIVAHRLCSFVESLKIKPANS